MVIDSALTCPCGTIIKQEDAIAILNNPSLSLNAKDINFANVFRVIMSILQTEGFSPDFSNTSNFWQYFRACLIQKFERDARIRGRIQNDLRNLEEPVLSISECWQNRPVFFPRVVKQSETGLEKSLVISREGQGRSGRGSQQLALLGLVGQMYSKIRSCQRATGTNHKDTKDTKIDRSYIS